MDCLGRNGLRRVSQLSLTDSGGANFNSRPKNASTTLVDCSIGCDLLASEFDQHWFQCCFQRHRISDNCLLLWVLLHPNRSSSLETCNKSTSCPWSLESREIWPCYQHHLPGLADYYVGIHVLSHRYSGRIVDNELELYTVGWIHDNWIGLVLHLAATRVCWTENPGWNDEPALDYT